MKQYKLSELVMDFDIYPRGTIDSSNAARLGEAIKSGAELPPILIDKKSKRIVDGFHRHRVYRILYGLNYKVLCVEKEYKSDKELFLDCVRLNSAHGMPMNVHDKTHSLIIAQKLGIDSEHIARALNLTIDKIGDLRAERIGAMIPNGAVALKNTIKHMAGKNLTIQQGQVNDKLGGLNQSFYVNQLIMLIESSLINLEDDSLVESLKKLEKLLLDLLSASVR